MALRDASQPDTLPGQEPGAPRPNLPDPGPDLPVPGNEPPDSFPDPMPDPRPIPAQDPINPPPGEITPPIRS